MEPTLRMTSREQMRIDTDTLDRLEAGLRKVAILVEADQRYIPIFERLLQERDALLKRRDLIAAAKVWANNSIRLRDTPRTDHASRHSYVTWLLLDPVCSHAIAAMHREIVKATCVAEYPNPQIP
ncbi:hypothetical protein [Roseobacter sp. HKCCA0434]|uniref:hypothetical protein n=1 Tax=Roseobacter sp. HKCCA0434 TaxID=3079297 RepID=UPI002905AF6A|nr:hypothetical protein [Roseobacter sp. HKCCA0434]